MSRATPDPAPAAGMRYDPLDAEPRWARAWLDSGLLRGDPESKREPFTIAVPPPNVTGSLHLGHALNGTIQDALIRWHRMAGREAEWICGTDHAGIATQAVVEKALLREEGVTRQELGREEFERRVWAWREQYGGRIIEQFQRLGCTLDYSRERFTMDEDYVRAVLTVFVSLYEKGHLYRDRYMVNWDPGLRSAISDLEVEDRVVVDTLVRIGYPLADGSGEVVIATVRPETMLGDTGVAVNPNDERYRHLIGRTAVLPLVGRELPIVGDRYVDPEFGTGALKVTPAHDPNDFEIGRRHGLEQVGVIGEDGRMTEAAGEAYAGLTTAECAVRVLEDLGAQGFVRGEEPYRHSVPFSQRSGARVEPLISLQWFCDMKALAAPAIAAVEDGRVRFHPARWGNVYLRWMGEIRPWCVSRQLWWGHRLPVWYRGGETYVGLEPPAGDGWERDPDVLDTWFSSALWPFATLGWPDDTAELRRFYPTQVLVTARDIIFLWVARMVMMGHEYTGEEPFSDVIITSTIQAPDGRRMSKSLGTGIDPLDVIAEHGADALRFGLLLMSSTQDVRYSEERVRQGRQLVTKLWNATRLVVDRGGAVGPADPPLERLADRWIASRTAGAVAECERLLARYELSATADLVYHVIFDDYCDWYLELLKAGEATPETAGAVLEQLLAMAHPLMPFVTEECWARLPGAEGLMLAHPPPAAPGPEDSAADAEMAAVREDVTRIRAERAERGLPPRAPMLVGLPPGRSDEAVSAVLALADPITLGPAAEEGVVTVAPAELDPAAERERLGELLGHAEAERARAEGKLGNAGFVARAPSELVAAEREKAVRHAAEAEALRARLAELERR